ncbi:hypothetical protein SLA2020_115720 [Shorea laevis]
MLLIRLTLCFLLLPKTKRVICKSRLKRTITLTSSDRHQSEIKGSIIGSSIGGGSDGAINGAIGDSSGGGGGGVLNGASNDGIINGGAAAAFSLFIHMHVPSDIKT